MIKDIPCKYKNKLCDSQYLLTKTSERDKQNFSQEHLAMANKHMKKYCTMLVTKF